MILTDHPYRPGLDGRCYVPACTASIAEHLPPDPLDVTPRDPAPALHPEDDAATWYLTLAGIVLVATVVVTIAALAVDGRV